MTKKEETEIDALLRNIWERNIPTLHERLNVLDRAALAAASGRFNEINQPEALDIAHKLSGSLGMFGYHHGTEIARRIEQILNAPTPATLICLTSLVEELRHAVDQEEI